MPAVALAGKTTNASLAKTGSTAVAGAGAAGSTVNNGGANATTTTTAATTLDNEDAKSTKTSKTNEKSKIAYLIDFLSNERAAERTCACAFYLNGLSAFYAETELKFRARDRG